MIIIGLGGWVKTSNPIHLMLIYIDIGKFTVESAENQGIAFMNEQQTSPSPLIIVIEDNPDTQRMLTKQLKFHGFSVICKGDGSSGLDWLATNSADLVILFQNGRRSGR